MEIHFVLLSKNGWKTQRLERQYNYISGKETEGRGAFIRINTVSISVKHYKKTNWNFI